MRQTLCVLLTIVATFSTSALAAEPAPKKTKPQLVETFTTALTDAAITHERTGTLSYNRQVRIFNQEEGRIEDMPWYEGDAVKAGDELVRLDGALIRAELARAEAEVRQAKVDLKRISDLVTKRAASRDELARARTAVEVAEAEASLLRTRLGYTIIRAPFDGIVTERRIEPGDVAPRYSHLLTVADPASLLIETRVSGVLLPQLQPGDIASVRIDAVGTKTVPGRILRVHPKVDPATRLGVVEVLLDPVPPGARAGQFARVTLTGRSRPRLLVPFNALRRDQEGEYVFLVRDGKATRQAVTSGVRIGENIEVIAGLTPGQQLVSRGFLGLTEGKAVKATAAP